MIELTATHKSIIERKKQGIPDSTIRKWCGLSESQYIDAVQHIASFQKVGPVSVDESTQVTGRKAAAYRVLCDAKKWMRTADIATELGLATRDVGNILRVLKKDGLVKMKPSINKQTVWRVM